MTFEESHRVFTAMERTKRAIDDGVDTESAFETLNDVLVSIANEQNGRRVAQRAAILSCSNALLEIK